MDKLEQIFRYGIGESAINIAPGGILQEFISDQSAMDMSMVIRQEAHISEPVLSDYLQKLIEKANELNGVDDDLKALYDAIVDKNSMRNTLIVTDNVLRNLSKVQEILKVSHNLIPKDHVVEDSDLKSSLKSMYDKYPSSFKKLFQSKT